MKTLLIFKHDTKEGIIYSSHTDDVLFKGIFNNLEQFLDAKNIIREIEKKSFDAGRKSLINSFQQLLDSNHLVSS